MEKNLVKITNQANLVLIIIQILIVAAIWRALPPEIPLFYSRPWGQDQLAHYPLMTTLPAVSLIIFVTNFIVAKIANKEEVLIKKMLAVGSLTFSFLILISLIQIIRLIT